MSLQRDDIGKAILGAAVAEWSDFTIIRHRQ
jgi:hypothetical protein